MKHTKIALLTAALLVCACEESDSESACIVTECPKPDNAKAMACGYEGCFVKTCDDGYMPASDSQKCITAASCVAAQCEKPDNATEMDCLDGACVVKSCSADYVVSEDKKACVCPTQWGSCKNFGETKCCGDSEYKCDCAESTCTYYMWWSNKCSDKLQGGWCGTYTYTEKGWTNPLSGCVSEVRGDHVCDFDNHEKRIYGTHCNEQWNQFATAVCHRMDDGRYAFVGEPQGLAISICKPGAKDIRIVCNAEHRTYEETCKNCKETFNGANFVTTCEN